jgi:hypothetical protein
MRPQVHSSQKKRTLNECNNKEYEYHDDDYYDQGTFNESISGEAVGTIIGISITTGTSNINSVDLQVCHGKPPMVAGQGGEVTATLVRMETND